MTTKYTKSVNVYISSKYMINIGINLISAIIKPQNFMHFEPKLNAKFSPNEINLPFVAIPNRNNRSKGKCSDEQRQYALDFSKLSKPEDDSGISIFSFESHRQHRKQKRAQTALERLIQLARHLPD